jgi:hypothetical protein
MVELDLSDLEGYLPRSGTRAEDDVRRGSARLESWDDEPIELKGVRMLVVRSEALIQDRLAVLPRSIYPTSPPVVAWHVLNVSESQWGSFAMAEMRLSCRAGLRPREYSLLAYVNSEHAAAGLGSRRGGRLQVADVKVDFNYDDTPAEVRLDGQQVLAVNGVDPTPVSASDIQWVATMSPALTPDGELRLLQVERDIKIQRAEKMTPRFVAYQPEKWYQPPIGLGIPIAAIRVNADISMAPIRYHCSATVRAELSNAGR